MESKADNNFQFQISLSVLNHLGRNLYRNFITVLGEAISNSWDADANNVWIDINKEDSLFTIKDDGIGMDADDFQSKFLKIGYSKRREGQNNSATGRPYIGAKGIGKLALLSCADRISIFTKYQHGSYVGGVIDNSGLDNAIQNDLVPDEYPLENLNFDLINKLKVGHTRGTIIVFENTKDQIRNSVAHLKKLLAMSFRFSLIDKKFNIFVNGDLVTIDDLKDLMNNTEFLWQINNFSDEYIKGLTALKDPPIAMITALDISGFAATVVKPSHAKISGTDERATIDLFVNGRLREKNIIRHIPTQRLVEVYIYGQIHFDSMDQNGDTPFTSSREGIVEDDKNFQQLLDYLKKVFLPKVLDDWDKLRLSRDQEGDDENIKRKSKKDRKARDAFNAAKAEYRPKEGMPPNDEVEKWMKELGPDAEFNISAYVDCFLSENLVRKYIHSYEIQLSSETSTEINKWKKQEQDRKNEAGISYSIRAKDDDLSYLNMDYLAITAEGSKHTGGKPSPLWSDAISYRPVRNVVGHTGLLTTTAKKHMSVTYENIKARVRKLLVLQK